MQSTDNGESVKSAAREAHTRRVAKLRPWRLAVRTLACLFLADVTVPFAVAHVVLEQPRASAGGYYKAVFQVSHGCSGSATNRLTVQVPDGVSGIKPMPKPGWSLSIQGGTEVTWTGGVLADAHYDEFVMLTRLPAKPGKVYFKVLQECEKGRQDWVQVPELDKPARDTRFPAPVLVIETAPQDHSHH